MESQSVREGIHRARPTSLDEAIQAALETENFERVGFQRRNERMKQGKFFRALDQETETRFQMVEQMLSQQSQQMETITQFLVGGQGSSLRRENSTGAQNEPRAERKYYNCGKPGHFSASAQSQRRRNSVNGEREISPPEDPWRGWRDVRIHKHKRASNSLHPNNR